ncbi:hypothetical protein [Brevibacillus daliensis]|uniref:hypothetical protein n=1 Tax=Brevibacillus daliensis TaxID=2892995 RepID=UPI001E446AE6|nr:hypothetical protein [Brevibacillus daliensis]
MSKLFAILSCIVFTIGIVVSTMSTLNEAIVKENGLQDKTVHWIQQALPEELPVKE